MMDIKKLLEKSIKVKNETYRIFSLLSKRSANPDMKQILGELAQEDLEHRDLLRSVFSSEKSVISEKALDKTFLELKIIDEDSTPNEIISFALLKTNASYNFYKNLKDLTSERNLESIYQKIANIELALGNRVKQFINERFKDFKEEKCL